eukprot:1137672-Pelagomonas_calceolata.AAC.1
MSLCTVVNTLNTYPGCELVRHGKITETPPPKGNGQVCASCRWTDEGCEQERGGPAVKECVHGEQGPSTAAEAEEEEQKAKKAQQKEDRDWMALQSCQSLAAGHSPSCAATAK